VPFKSIAPLASGGFVDYEVINDLIENDNALKAMATGIVMQQGNQIMSGDSGDKFRIQSGIFNVPTFKGNIMQVIKFPVAHTAKWTPIVIFTPLANANITVSHARVPVATSFAVRILSPSKQQMRGIKIFWVAITGY